MSGPLSTRQDEDKPNHGLPAEPIQGTRRGEEGAYEDEAHGGLLGCRHLRWSVKAAAMIVPSPIRSSCRSTTAALLEEPMTPLPTTGT